MTDSRAQDEGVNGITEGDTGDLTEIRNGWIALNRRIVNHWLWEDKDDKPYSRLQAWLDILLTVRWEEKGVGQKEYKGEVYEYGRGECIMSLYEWGKRWGWKRKKVRCFFELLQRDKMVELSNEGKNGKVITRVRVVNYDKYQFKNGTSGTCRKSASRKSPIKNGKLPRARSEKNLSSYTAKTYETPKSSPGTGEGPVRGPAKGPVRGNSGKVINPLPEKRRVNSEKSCRNVWGPVWGPAGDKKPVFRKEEREEKRKEPKEKRRERRKDQTRHLNPWSNTGGPKPKPKRTRNKKEITSDILSSQAADKTQPAGPMPFKTLSVSDSFSRTSDSRLSEKPILFVDPGTGQRRKETLEEVQERLTSYRRLCRMKWSFYTERLWAARGTSQRLSDETSALNIFDEVIWPEHVSAELGRQRYEEFLGYIDQASKRTRPMAWLTAVAKKHPVLVLRGVDGVGAVGEAG